MIYTENKAGVRFVAPRETYANTERVTTAELLAIDVTNAYIQMYVAESHTEERPIYAPYGAILPKVFNDTAEQNLDAIHADYDAFYDSQKHEPRPDDAPSGDTGEGGEQEF